MKNLAKCLMTAAMIFTTMTVSAKDDLTNTEASKLYSQQIDITKSEIVTLKKKIKLEPLNEQYNRELHEKQVDLDILKSKKKVVDEAIKAEKNEQKKAEAAKKASKKADQAANAAEKAERNAEMATEKAISIIDPNLTLEQANEQYEGLIDLTKTEIATLKKQKKLEPGNYEIDMKINEKKAEIKDLQTKKKVVTDALKATKNSTKAKKNEEKAVSNSKEADKKANNAKRDAEKAVEKANKVK